MNNFEILHILDTDITFQSITMKLKKIIMSRDYGHFLVNINYHNWLIAKHFAKTNKGKIYIMENKVSLGVCPDWAWGQNMSIKFAFQKLLHKSIKVF